MLLAETKLKTVPTFLKNVDVFLKKKAEERFFQIRIAQVAEHIVTRYGVEFNKSYFDFIKDHNKPKIEHKERTAEEIVESMRNKIGGEV